MKKIWFFVALFNLTVLSTYSQNIRFAIFADPVISWIKTDVSSIESDGARPGINAGLMVDKFFAEHYAFTTGISIRSMGGFLNYTKGKNPFNSSSDIDSLRPGTSVKYKLQYLHIPLSIKLRTTEIGYFTYFAHLGLDPMINIKANADIESRNIKNANVSREIKNIYMGYHIGVGLEYKILGNTAFTTGLTYINGFTDVTDNNSSAEKAVMHSFELRLGIIF